MLGVSTDAPRNHAAAVVEDVLATSGLEVTPLAAGAWSVTLPGTRNAGVHAARPHHAGGDLIASLCGNAPHEPEDEPGQRDVCERPAQLTGV